MNLSSLQLLNNPTSVIERSERQIDASTRFGNLGRALVAAAVVVQIFALALSGTSTLSGVMNGDLERARGAWVSELAVVLILAGAMLLVLRHLWARDAREPFRYTFFVSEFDEVAFPDDAGPHLLERLVHDLTERMCEGMHNRLALLEEKYVERSKARRSHVHIRGDFAHRPRPERGSGSFDVQVRAWVRVGSSGQPEQLAPPVNYTVSEHAVGLSDYDRILDRVYFSVTTAIYKQIQRDVDRKINQLPSRRLRAKAYFYEAEDYAKSNTLDAYAEAEALYRRAIDLFEPWAAGLPRNHMRRWLTQVGHLRVRLSYAVCRGMARVAPRFGRSTLLLARAEIGTARTLLYRRQLGGLSGEPIGPIFEVPDLLQAADKRLKKLPDDVPDRTEARFEAQVLLALAKHLLGAPEEAKLLVAKARKLNPRHAHLDPTLAFVSAQLQTHRVLRLQLMRAAVELSPKDQVARYCLARELEMTWRQEGALERTVAEEALEGYREVIALNPGVITSWSNYGYVHWLLGSNRDLDDAWDALLRGREYKGIKASTFVSEIDLGLGRIAAERGEILDAYRYFDASVTALLAREPHDVHNDVPDYWHQYISAEMVERFDAYRDRALAQIARAGSLPIPGLATGGPEDGSGRAHPPTQRICDAVRAYVLADHAAAVAAYGRRFEDQGWLDVATAEYEEAAALNPRFIPARHALVLLYCDRNEPRRARQRVDEIRKLDPDWPEGILADVEVPRFDGSRLQSRAAVRRLLEAPWPKGESPMRDWWRDKFHDDSSLDPDEADAVATARYLVQAKDRRPALTAPQVEVLAVWARALAQRRRPPANIAAAGLAQLVERWYFPNYTKVQQICGEAVGSLLSQPRQGYGDPLDDVQKSVVKTIVERCKQYAKVERSNGNHDEAARWNELSRDVASWMQPLRRANGRAAVSAQEAYDRMIVANLRSLADLDPESKRLASQLQELEDGIEKRRDCAVLAQ